MKKIFIFGVMILFLIQLINAISDPAPIYCENMGYHSNVTHCVFSSNESCELGAFYNGECGQDYVIELTCKQSGEPLLPGYECCESLKSISVSSPTGPDNTCTQSTGGWPICTPCGNGICDDNENICNCPEDCEEDETLICTTDDDCEIIFSNCGCKSVCSIKTNETLIDCARACSIQETDNTILKCSCENGKCISNYDIAPEGKVCCHKFGYGNQMKVVNSKYQYIEREDCAVPEGFVGGGREVVNNQLCEQYKNTIRTKNRIKAHYTNESECPEDCTCAGSTVKCQIEGGRQMTVYAGKSGNMIVQIKGINMSTKVELYKNENGTLVGKFKNNQTKIIKVLPDGVKEKIRQRTRARLEEHNITLDEDGIYQVQARKRARLFGLIPIRERIRTEINSETGEIIRTRTSWWGFLARDVKEDLVGGCGTVTPGMEDECCQNLGYDVWNSEILECE